MADTHKARWQDMHQEALDEGVGMELFDLCTIPLLVVAERKANLVALHVEQAMVGNRHPVSITAQVVEGSLGRAKRGFGVDDPLLLANVLDKALERLWALQVVGVRCEAQGLLVVEPF